MSGAARAYYVDLMRKVAQTTEWAAFRTWAGLSGEYLSGQAVYSYWQEVAEQ